MKTRVLLMVFVAVVLVMAVGFTVSPAAAGDAVVPFRATYVTYPITVDSTGGVNTLEIPGEGRGLHLGRSEFYADSWVDTNYYPFIQTGDMTLTSANGDELFGTFAGTAVPTSLTAVAFSGTFEITEGSGRFEGMTGSGTYQGTADREMGEGALYFEGVLTK